MAEQSQATEQTRQNQDILEDASIKPIEPPVTDPNMRKEDGGLWPSRDWRPGDRAQEERAARDKNAAASGEKEEEFDAVAGAGDYKAGLD